MDRIEMDSVSTSNYADGAVTLTLACIGLQCGCADTKVALKYIHTAHTYIYTYMHCDIKVVEVSNVCMYVCMYECM